MKKIKNEVQTAALRLLTFRDRSIRELTARLERRFAAAEVTEVISYLQEIGYLNDFRFARNYVDSRNRNHPRGNYLLRLELSKKGVADQIIEEVLNSPEQEYQLALDLARKCFSSEEIEGLKRAQRLCSLLQRRGFPWSTVGRVVGELLDSDPQKDYN